MYEFVDISQNTVINMIKSCVPGWLCWQWCMCVLHSGTAQCGVMFWGTTAQSRAMILGAMVEKQSYMCHALSLIIIHSALIAVSHYSWINSKCYMSGLLPSNTVVLQKAHSLCSLSQTSRWVCVDTSHPILLSLSTGHEHIMLHYTMSLTTSIILTSYISSNDTPLAE